MRCTTVIGSFAVLLAGMLAASAQEMPEMPSPTAEHQWLQQLVGTWDAQATMYMPGEEPMTSKGTLDVRPVGGFWTIAKHQGEIMGQQYTGLQTLGYDAQKKQFVGTWVDSFGGHLWVYEGKLDQDGKRLTLSTHGPCPAAPGQVHEFKEVIEVKSDDHQVFTSSMKGDDGKWTTNMKIEYHRQK